MVRGIVPEESQQLVDVEDTSLPHLETGLLEKLEEGVGSKDDVKEIIGMIASEKPLWSIVYRENSTDRFMYMLHAFLAPFFLCRAFIISNQFKSSDPNRPIVIGFTQWNSFSRGDEGFKSRDENIRPYFLLKEGCSLITYAPLFALTYLEFQTFQKVDDSFYQEMKMIRSELKSSSCQWFPSKVIITDQTPMVRFEGSLSRNYHSVLKPSEFRTKYPSYNWNELQYHEINEVEPKKKTVFQLEEKSIVESWSYITFMEDLNTYYSEGVLFFLSIYGFITYSDIGTSIMLFIVSLVIMLINATRASPLIAFRDVSLKKKDGTSKELHKLDCAEDAALYVAPMVFNAIAVIILNQNVSQKNINILNLFTASISFGYLFFAGGMIGIDIYKLMMEAIIRRFSNDDDDSNVPSLWLFKIACVSIATMTVLAVWTLVGYFGLNPFTGQSYVAGFTIILIMIPVIGFKGVLVPYAFDNLGLLGGIAWIFKILVMKMKSFEFTELLKTMRICWNWIFDHKIEGFLSFLFFAGIIIMVFLVYSFQSIQYSFLDDQ